MDIRPSPRTTEGVGLAISEGTGIVIKDGIGFAEGIGGAISR